LAHSHRIFAAVLAALLAATARGADAPPPQATAIINPAIDAGAYLRTAFEAMRLREERRLSEADFIRMSREPGTVVLDARSKARFDELHLEGAINLSFPDIAIESLPQCRGAVSEQAAERLAQPLDLGGVVRLRLPQRLGARAVDRRGGDGAGLRILAANAALTLSRPTSPCAAASARSSAPRGTSRPCGARRGCPAPRASARSGCRRAAWPGPRR